MMKRTWYTIMYITASLFAISTLLTVYSGVGLENAIIWNVLSSLNIFYASVLLPFKSQTNPFVLAASLVDGIVFALLTVLVAGWFFSFIRSINVRSMIVLSKIRKLKRHIVVVPFGHLAGALMDELGSDGVNVVAITEHDNVARRLYMENKLVVVGNPRDEEIFEAANIKTAAFVIACSADDTENALIAITAKAVNPEVKVISRLANDDNMTKIIKAGAYRIMMPEVTAGLEIGKKLIKEISKKTD